LGALTLRHLAELGKDIGLKQVNDYAFAFLLALDNKAWGCSRLGFKFHTNPVAF